MLSRIVLNYQMQINNIEKLIDLSGFENNYLSQRIGLKPAIFLSKKQNGNWTTTEVLKIVSIIENKEAVENYLDSLKMERSEKGTFVSANEFEKRMKW